MYNYQQSLNSDKALIWRIVHRDNLPWILANGLHCGNAGPRSSDWVSIGNEELIGKRANHRVPAGPGGVLGEYVPFYFTPFSVMLKNIHSGRGAVKQRANAEIVILVSSLHHIKKQGLTYVFTDGHAYIELTNFYTDLADLDKIDWKILQQRNFKRDQDDPAKFERYQAEALIHKHCPVAGLLGIVCYTNLLKTNIEQQVAESGHKLAVHTRPRWYF